MIKFMIVSSLVTGIAGSVYSIYTQYRVNKEIDKGIL